MTQYIIDANILIQAYRKYYPMDVFISFWDRIQHLAHSDIVVSIDKVKGEIEPSGDDLSRWCLAQLPQNFFMDSAPCLPHYAKVIRTVVELDKYTNGAISEFSDASESDAFLVAMAMSSSDYVLVTEEIPQPQGKHKVKIPDVCALFGLRHINTVEMFRELGIAI